MPVETPVTTTLLMLIKATTIGQQGKSTVEADVDSWFGAKTAEAVKPVQAQRGLTITGIVNEDDWRKFLQAAIK
jgi:hypothetical protein